MTGRPDPPQLLLLEVDRATRGGRAATNRAGRLSGDTSRLLGGGSRGLSAGVQRWTFVWSWTRTSVQGWRGARPNFRRARAAIEADLPLPPRFFPVTPSKAVVFAREPSNGPALAPVSPGRFLRRQSVPALASVANRPLVRHALDWLDDCGVREVAIVVPEAVAPDIRRAVGDERDWSFGIRWLEQMPDERFLESLYALRAFLEDKPFVLHLADTLAKQDLRSLIGPGSTADDEALLLVPVTAARDGGHVVELRARRDGGTSTVARSGVPAGVAVIGPAVTEAGGALDAFPQCGLEVVADRVRELGGTVRTQTATGWWRYRAGADALLEGNLFALECLTADYDGATVVDADIQGAVIAHPSSRIESSVVRGPAVIGPGARLRNAYVGPYTSIGRDVVIEGAEVEHSIVMPEASIRHLGGRLEASIVGARAQVFRDFRLPTALRLNVGEGAEVSLA
jgi:glucose-1-phosphate thymidylyltransferase